MDREKTIKLASPRGFCAGVDRAIGIVNKALEVFPPPAYVRHEVVHNRHVVEELSRKGAIFVNELDEIPDKSVVIFSAHGVSKSIQKEAQRRNLMVLDATCPLVTKVHWEVIKYASEGYDCILVGHRGHPEVEGTMGQFDSSKGGQIHLVENEEQVDRLCISNSRKVAYVTQTTLSVDDTRRVIERMRARFPHIVGPRKDDICYATQNRQDAVRQLALEADIVLVVGSKNSSNSNRLRELAEHCGCKAYLIDCAEDIQLHWLQNCIDVGITAGASAPEKIVEAIVIWLQKAGFHNKVELQGRLENTHFSLPRSLQVREAQSDQ